MYQIFYLLGDMDGKVMSFHWVKEARSSKIQKSRCDLADMLHVGQVSSWARQCATPST